MERKYGRKRVFDNNGNLLPIENRTFTTNEGYKLIIIACGSKKNYVLAQINDYIFEARMDSILNSNIKYPYHSSILGKGHFGVGIHMATYENKISKIYSMRTGMLTRVYDETQRHKHPTYKDVKICKDWHNFQNFAEWYVHSNYQVGWQLDKDLLSETNSKIYSPETCIFIPPALNSFMTNIRLNNTSGYPGVSWHKDNNKWLAEISVIEIGKKVNLGYFTLAEEAGEAYKVARATQVTNWKQRVKHLLPSEVVNNIR